MRGGNEQKFSLEAVASKRQGCTWPAVPSSDERDEKYAAAASGACAVAPCSAAAPPAFGAHTSLMELGVWDASRRSCHHTHFVSFRAQPRVSSQYNALERISYIHTRL